MAGIQNIDESIQDIMQDGAQMRDEFVAPIQREGQLPAIIPEQKREEVQAAEADNQNEEQRERRNDSGSNERNGLPNEQNVVWINQGNQQRQGGRGRGYSFRGAVRRDNGQPQNVIRGGYGSSQPQNRNGQWAPYDDGRARRMEGAGAGQQANQRASYEEDQARRIDGGGV